MSKTKKLSMRAVQLDLARQPETVEFIEGFIDFISRYDYNTLVLYLEGRIRTKTFHHLPAKESYSEDEIRRIVNYAAERKIEVIPIISMFGHAEHFVEAPEFAHLAELRGDITGRFNKFKHMFCPSLPETIDFLECYLTEVAALFPSDWFHAGFDETWDIGYCELCRERLKTEKQTGIFSSHLLKCYEIVTGKLQKKMMIWDDMFELYPEALDVLPRDVVLCAWHYERHVEYPFGHIGAPRKDILKQYDQMGFKYLFAPATHFWRNAESFTEYALTRNPMGGLLTAWGITEPAKLPAVAATGELWSKGQVDFVSVIHEISQTEDPAIVQLLNTMIEAYPVSLSASPESYLKGPLSDAEYDFMLRNNMAYALLGLPQEEPVKETISIRIGMDKLYLSLRKWLPCWFGLGKGALDGPPLRTELSSLKNFAESLLARYGKMRTQTLCRAETVCSALNLQPVIDMLEKLISSEPPQPEAYLRLRFPSSSSLTISLRSHGEKGFSQIWQGGINQKPFPGEFQFFVPLKPHGTPEAIRVEHRGAVSAPLSYLEIISGEQRYVPQALSCVSGKVHAPSAVLMDGRDWCIFGEGEQLAQHKFLNLAETQAVNSIEVLLKPQE